MSYVSRDKTEQALQHLLQHRHGKEAKIVTRQAATSLTVNVLVKQSNNRRFIYQLPETFLLMSANRWLEATEQMIEAVPLVSYSHDEDMMNPCYGLAA